MLYDLDHHQELDNLHRATTLPTRSENEPSDEELMARIQGRDEHALEMLIKRCESLIRSVVGRMIANDTDVSDVVEETFLNIWNQASNFVVAKGKAVGWIITIALRRGIDRVRRRQAYDRAEMRFGVSTETGTSHFAGEDVEAEAANSETAAMFKELLATIPEAQRQVVHMAFYQGLSQREIARETGLPLGTVKTRLELGVKKLRNAVAAMGSRNEWFPGAA